MLRDIEIETDSHLSLMHLICDFKNLLASHLLFNLNFKATGSEIVQ